MSYVAYPALPNRLCIFLKRIEKISFQKSLECEVNGAAKQDQQQRKQARIPCGEPEPDGSGIHADSSVAIR